MYKIESDLYVYACVYKLFLGSYFFTWKESLLGKGEENEKYI